MAKQRELRVDGHESMREALDEATCAQLTGGHVQHVVRRPDGGASVYVEGIDKPIKVYHYTDE